MKTAVYTIVSICAAVFLSIAPTQAQQIDFSKVEMRTIPVADGIYMLIGQGGNIGVCIGEDGVFLIDDQFAPLTDKIVSAVRELTDMPIKFLINTHWHSDHTGANENFGKMGVTIIAQDNVYARMSVDQTNPFSGNVIEAAPPDALPVITFNDEITFHMNGYTIHGKRIGPAHTDGDAYFHFMEAAVYHMGDTYFSEAYPFFDLNSGGDFIGMVKVAEDLLAMADSNTKIIPGHGRLADRSDLESYHAMLVGLRDKVQDGIDKGMTVNEMFKANITEDFDAEWGGGFMAPEFVIQNVYNSLTN